VTDLLQQIRDLSPAKRDLLVRRLQLQRYASAEPTHTIPPTSGKRFPLSYAQERIWFLQQVEPESVAYHCPLLMRVSGPLDLTTLHNVFVEIIRRHAILRTTFVRASKGIEQVVALAGGVPFRIIDWRARQTPGSDADAMRQLAAEARRPFDLNCGPLFRLTVLRLSDRDHLLLVNMHHLVSDGWSIAVLVRELVALYQAFSLGRPSPLDELPIQYGDFSLWQRQQFEEGCFDDQLAYWRGQLVGAPAALALPTVLSRPAVRTLRGATRSFVVATEVTAALEETARQQRATLFMTLLASFQSWLVRHTGQRDIVVGCPVAVRPNAETQNLIGLFLNTVPLRARLSDKSTFRELLEQVRQTSLEAYAHQDLPFAKLVEDLRPRRDATSTPIFQSMFVLNPEHGKVQAAGLTLSPPLELESGTAQFDISLSMGQTDEDLRGTFEYSVDVFSPRAMDHLTTSFVTFLYAIAAGPDRCVGDLPLRPKAATDRMNRSDDATTVGVSARQETKPSINESHSPLVSSDESVATESADAELCRPEQPTSLRQNSSQMSSFSDRLEMSAPTQQAPPEHGPSAEPAGAQLVAFVVARRRDTFSTTAIRAFLRERLPDYMIPSRIVVLDALPMNANGKVDRSALRVSASSNPEPPLGRLCAKTDVEHIIAAIWQDVLGLETVSVQDNFFDVGGNSFSMLEVLRRAEELFEQKMSVLEMFKHPTVESMARYLSARRENTPVYGRAKDRAAIRKTRLVGRNTMDNSPDDRR
jgi:Condensation domain/Phosphopantetheine attachment site/AMP-binding enzyme C-terminal domain